MTNEQLNNPISQSATNRHAEADKIARIVAGDSELFYELMKPCERPAFLMAYSILRNEADAEEAVQEAALHAYKALATFRCESSFRTWLIRITLNEARMRLRRTRAALQVSIDDVSDDGDYTPIILRDWREIPSEVLDREEVRRILRSAIDGLPDIYREVFIARDVDELNIEETASLLGINVGMVKTRLLRARLMMQKRVAPQLQGYTKGGRK